MQWLDDLKEKLSEAVLNGFATLTPDLHRIDAHARTYSADGWQALHTAAVGASGACSAVIPGLHLLGLVADTAFLVNRMAVCSYGIGAIAAKANGHGYILENEDMAAILARWSGDDSVSDAAIAKMSGVGAAMFAAQPLGNVFAKMAVKHAGMLVGNKLGGKVGAKVSAKFVGKYLGKAIGGAAPFIGPGICASINIWFITQMCTAAAGWYATKLKYIPGPDSGGTNLPPVGIPPVPPGRLPAAV